MYQSIYELIHTYVYSGVALTADMELVCTLLSTFGCIMLVAIPFLIVYRLIRLVLM